MLPQPLTHYLACIWVWIFPRNKGLVGLAVVTCYCCALCAVWVHFALLRLKGMKWMIFSAYTY